MFNPRRIFAYTVSSYALLIMLIACHDLRAQQFNEDLFKAMKWRLVGPFRGGRGLAVSGVPGDPTVYYFGAVSGGVWKTTKGLSQNKVYLLSKLCGTMA